MNWIRGKKLGHGSFATVNLAVPNCEGLPAPPFMAVKSCGFSHSSSLMNEKLILEELKDCPEIIRCFGESVTYENGEKLYNVLLEYASGGSLADKLKNSDAQRLPESEVRGYTKALLRGLHYIHKIGYVHCDIKLQNILLSMNGALKIADFGLAKRTGVECELRGTPLYMSPEMVIGGGGDQGAPADIWAVGCVVSEMLSGTPAWRRRCSDVAGLLMRIGLCEEVPEIPTNVSEEAKDFLGRIFVKDPSERWTAEMLLNHPFVCDEVREDIVSTTSPRCPFDFPDLMSVFTCSITDLPPPEVVSDQLSSALRELIDDQAPLDWSVSDDWVTVRVSSGPC